ncbi:hypothetical protein QCA50_010948 [Cerrena zonata]|uniref:Uncharacterized protein n=1 Tax=Cerrena zonata TaxID=2478898 RepID=A0AAW0FYT2_9APHY
MRKYSRPRTMCIFRQVMYKGKYVMDPMSTAPTKQLRFNSPVCAHTINASGKPNFSNLLACKKERRTRRPPPLHSVRNGAGRLGRLSSSLCHSSYQMHILLDLRSNDLQRLIIDVMHQV